MMVTPAQSKSRRAPTGYWASKGIGMNKAILAIAPIALLAGCGEEAEAPDQTVQQLMAEVVQPTTEIYWDSVQYISDEEGMHEIVPETDADWQRTRDAAVRIQEFGELLQTPAYSQDRGEDWTQISQSLVEVGGTIYNVCSACHQVYPATVGPEAEGAERPV